MRALREANLARVLAVLPDGEELNQSAIVTATGLSAASVSGLVAELADAAKVTVRVGMSNGRRARLVSRVAESRRFGAGIDIGRSHVRVLIGDQGGEIAAEEVAGIAPGVRPEEALRLVIDLLHAATARAGLQASDLEAISIATVSSLDPVSRAVTSGPAGSIWTDFPLVEGIEAATHRPVVIENDANLGALALSRTLDSTRGLLFIKVGSGIGGGLVIDGRLMRGNVGTVGEIGHLTLDPRLAITCECGRRGCLETMSSSEAMRRSLSVALGRELSISECVDLVHAGNPVALTVVDEAGTLLGRALGWIAQTINPAAVYLDGPFFVEGDAMLAAVRAGFRQSVWPAIFASTVLDLSPLADRTVALGALVEGMQAR